MGLNLTVLGCCGSYPAPSGGGACSGYLVQGAGTTVWVDAGSGTLDNLQRHAELHDVDAIVLSHEHPDHWSDLEAYWVAAKYVLQLGKRTVYAPSGLQAHTYHDAKDPWFEWHDVDDGDVVPIGGLTFTFSDTGHGPTTLAMRIDGDGRTLAYSADTPEGWSFAAFGTGIDLALCEATLQAPLEGTSKHLSARQAGRMSAEAGVDRLLLTHIWPTLDREVSRREGAEAFGGDVEIAVTNERYEV
jgi:ribonuclease BN (tRNA processing enzyme)